MKDKKLEELKNVEIDALSEFSDQISEIMNSMDDYRIFVNKEDLRKFDKTYKNLGYFWEQLQNRLIYLWDVDERNKN